jgi:choline-sulfatase
MILAGPDVPSGNRVDAPVSLVDVFQTTIDSLGVPTHSEDANLPGHSLIGIARGDTPQRTVVSEYHAAAAQSGAYMIRHGDYKHTFASFRDFVPPPLLFDLRTDPEELQDLHQIPRMPTSLPMSCCCRLFSIRSRDAPLERISRP